MTMRPWGLLTAAGTIACIATVFGFLGQFSWFLDLFSHFRVQYFIGLCILGLIFLAFKHRQAGIVFLIFGFVNLCTILPLFFGGETAPTHEGNTLRAILLNVNTQLGDTERTRKFIQENSPDFVILEEISARWVKDLQWLALSHQYSYIQPREDNFGIGLFGKFPFKDVKTVNIGDAEVPSIIVKTETRDGSLTIIATHPLPPGGASYSKLRNGQLDKLPDYIPESLPVVLIGDLNTTPWNHYFKRLLRRTGLKDSSQGRGVQPTWPNFNPFLRIPLDHCLYSSEIAVLSKKIGPDVGSDHFPVIVDFVIRAKDNNSKKAELIAGQDASGCDLRGLTKSEIIENILISIAVLALIGFFAVSRAIMVSQQRSLKVLEFTSKIHNTVIFTLNETGIELSGDDDSGNMACSSFKITTCLFCSEEELFNKVKEALSKQSVKIVIDGVKTALPFSAIVGRIDYKGDAELETRKATMEYVATLRHAGHKET